MFIIQKFSKMKKKDLKIQPVKQKWQKPQIVGELNIEKTLGSLGSGHDNTFYQS